MPCNPTAEYNPGDVLACGGTDWISRVIKLGTFSPYSHVAIVAENKGLLYAFESTTLSSHPCALRREKVRGVQAHRLDHWLARRGHQGTAVWRVPLAPDWRLRRDQSHALTDHLISSLGQSYDAYAAILSAPRIADLVLTKLLGQEGRERSFCSQLVVRALKARDVEVWSGETNSRCWNPGEVVRHLVWSEKYLQPVRVV